MEIERTPAALLGMQVDLPQLAQRIRLDEMALVVHMEPVIHGMALQLCDESGHIDDCHASRHYREER